MLRRNIMIYTAAILAVASFFIANAGKVYSSVTVKPRQFALADSLAKLNTLSMPEKGISKNEMLKRFGPANALLMEYDKELETDVTRYYYQIGDSEVYIEFVSSWKQNHEIVDFSLKEGYQMIYFTDYGY